MTMLPRIKSLRRLPLSLRGLLLGMTLLSAALAWQLHARARAVREQVNIMKLFAGRDSRIRFHDSLLGWKLPDEATWLRCLAFPEPVSASLAGREVAALSEDCCAAARRCRRVECHGPFAAGDLGLRRCLSSLTTDLSVWGNGTSIDCPHLAAAAPQLRRVEIKFGALDSKFVAALLNHPRIEVLEIDADAEELSLLGELAGGSGLRQLTVDLQSVRTPLQASFAFPAAPTSDFAAGAMPAASGSFVWLKGCERLQELTFATPTHSLTIPTGEKLWQDPALIQAVGRHLCGVEKLNLRVCRPEIVEALVDWTRLRHLCLDGVNLDDQRLARIVRLCPGLQTLEIDEYSQTRVSLSPPGLRSLHDLRSLKRLRLGTCRLTREHMETIADLERLEELSLEDAGVTDRTVEPLKKLPRLTRINLTRTAASDAAFSAIRGDWNESRPWRN